MWISVSEAVTQLEQRGLLRHHKHDHPDKTIDFVSGLIGQPLPRDLEDFYRARIDSVGDFQAVAPKWNAWVEWRNQSEEVTQLLHAQAVPLLGDGCGNLFGLDLTAGDTTPAVYLFDHEREYAIEYAAGSSLGAFLLVLADTDQAFREGWPERWELAIDPDIDKCPRAPAIWNAS